jgi:hypothetical protein
MTAAAASSVSNVGGSLLRRFKSNTATDSMAPTPTPSVAKEAGAGDSDESDGGDNYSQANQQSLTPRSAVRRLASVMGHRRSGATAAMSASVMTASTASVAHGAKTFWPRTRFSDVFKTPAELLGIDNVIDRQPSAEELALFKEYCKMSDRKPVLGQFSSLPIEIS